MRLETKVEIPDPAQRRLPVGAELRAQGVHFRVWAEGRGSVEVLLEQSQPESAMLTAEGDGYFSGMVPGLKAGARYWLRLDGEVRVPDPVSRFQPEGPHGPSEVIDPAYPWQDDGWHGVTRDGLIVYELHIGTYTPEGTWAAAEQTLPWLAEMGINLIEVMPVADFCGDFGWGYDGVAYYAPYRRYGRPDDFRHFVDSAHRLGVGVILDVVYNHFGPSGCSLPLVTPHYRGGRQSEWGDVPNYDGPHCAPVREYFCANAGYWIDEFHLDGLRIDATQQVFDDSERHILADVVAAARRAAGNRTIYIVGENEPQNVRELGAPDAGGHGFDALWNDDFHHSARVALTGRREAYLQDYRGEAQEFISAARHGFLYQGQYYAWQQQRRGTPALHLPCRAWVHYLENHDQIANSASGKHLYQRAAPAAWRALSALLLLGPQTPMLFQGQEFASSKPFLYFADHDAELAAAVKRGRQEFLSQFPSIATAEISACLADPADAAVFAACKLDPAERQNHVEAVALYRDLLHLRRQDEAVRHVRHIDGAVLGPRAFVLRYSGKSVGERLLLINLGPDLALDSAPEPLLAPPAGRRWSRVWYSEDPRYGGDGDAWQNDDRGWHLTAQSALWLSSHDA